ncbi:MAG TPA: hypothetical protein VFH99_04415 [Candidatus Saccharimonadales bacterium]|nr:hypothetical protein [Candidatus Saccharimonadales bacterium]
MDKGGKPAHIETFDSASKPAGEIWATPSATAGELYHEPSLLKRLGHAGLEMARGMQAVGKIAINGDIGEMVRNLRQF